MSAETEATLHAIAARLLVIETKLDAVESKLDTLAQRPAAPRSSAQARQALIDASLPAMIDNVFHKGF